MGIFSADITPLQTELHAFQKRMVEIFEERDKKQTIEYNETVEKIKKQAQIIREEISIANKAESQLDTYFRVIQQLEKATEAQSKTIQEQAQLITHLQKELFKFQQIAQRRKKSGN